MEFSILHRFTKEKIITVEYKRGENKWLLAVRAAIEAKISLSEANLTGANLSRANLTEANLTGANLTGANLTGADLSWANLDFSTGFTFACKTFNIKADIRLAAQLAYHFCRFDFGDCEEAKQAQAALKELANKFHRVRECGKIE